MQELNRRCHDDTCQEAADRAVKKVFAILGVDVDKPDSVEEFREDLRFGKRLYCFELPALVLGISTRQRVTPERILTAITKDKNA